MRLVANSQYQKIANSCLIINELTAEQLSRADLSHKLGLQPSSVTYSTARLIEAGLVQEMESATSGGKGRKGIPLALNPAYGMIYGIELLVGFFRIIGCDIGGAIVTKGVFDYDETVTAEKGTRKRFQQLLACAKRKMESLNEGLPIRGACIAISGIISEDAHTIIDSWTHMLHAEDFADLLLESPYPVWFENDANCAAGRYLHKDKNTKDSFLYALVHYYQNIDLPSSIPSVGIGMGLVIEGAIYRGWTNRAGEFRSVLYSGNSTVGQLSLSNADLVNLKTDETLQKALIKELLSNLFFAEAILNPRVIYLGGDLVKRNLVEDVLQEDFPTMKEYIKQETGLFSVVEDATWDVSYGACIMVRDAMFHIPRLGEQHLKTWQWRNAIGNGDKES